MNPSPPPPPRVEVLTAYLSPTVVGNMRHHSNRHIILSLYSPRAELHRLASDALAGDECHNGHNKDAYDVLYRFPARSCLGLTRLDKYRYVVITSEKQSDTTQATPINGSGNSVIWLVDLEAFEREGGPVEATELADISLLQERTSITTISDDFTRDYNCPNTTDCNSADAIPAKWPAILLADSSANCIHQFDLNTRQISLWFSHPTMQPKSGSPPISLPVQLSSLGINAIRYKSGYLYYNNPSTRSLYRVEINPITLSPSTSPKCLSTSHSRRMYWLVTSVVLTRTPRFPACSDICISSPSPTDLHIYATGEGRVVHLRQTRKTKKWKWFNVPSMPFPDTTCVVAGTGERSRKKWLMKKTEKRQYIWVTIPEDNYEGVLVGGAVLRFDNAIWRGQPSWGRKRRTKKAAVAPENE
ncbi:hypothetical protein K504DRAFT_447702 [Pleomassaria siparia CBS 279.74]|uniref:Uncharacterized protein n=1 Tax=Pleomassaria siparia CBS 279.74 TaxID=1314801 RepID=A0A6G1K362_9PLEO|nr:hypothetical protein K504DRAFT_447702 [Pleomassaria siparia CBS 279.74]